MTKKFILFLGCCCLATLGFASNPAYDSFLDSLRMKAPTFSHQHAYYQEPFQLSISSVHQGAIIKYTTDGSEPTAEHGSVYQGPIKISKTSVIRACVLPPEDEYYQSRITTATYLFIEDILQQSNKISGYPDKWGPYATRSGTAKADYEMDPELTATQAQRDSITKGFLSLPAISIVTDKSYIFNQENDAKKGGIYIYTDPPTGYTHTYVSDPGHKWMRPTSMEMFDQEGTISIQADCGLRLHGGHSRLPEKSPKHSFRFVFKEEYGKKKLKANIFGPTQAKKLDHLVLRAGFCNTWIHANTAERAIAAYTRDTWAKEVQGQMGHPYSHYRYAHLFINGIYWGLYNITERIDEHWCEEYLGGFETDYDVIKQEDNSPNAVYADQGTIDNWNQLFKLSEKSASDANYQAIDQLLDIENFIDYMIINIYGGNTDWDHHNWLAVKNFTLPDDGFKLFCWDSEHVLKDLHQDIGLGKMRELCPSTLMQNLMKYPQFRRLVGDRIQKQCFQNGPLEPENTTAIWNKLSAEISSALHCEAARWGDYRRDVHQWSSGPYELYTKATHYDPLQKKIVEEILPYRRDVFIEQMISHELFPTVAAPRILVNDEYARSKTYWENDVVTIDFKDNIYYTLDGSDPVVWDKDGNGSASSTAKKYAHQEFTLMPAGFHLRARILKNGQWSALSELYLPETNIATAMESLPIAENFQLEKSLIDNVLRLHYQSTQAHIRWSIVGINGQVLRQEQSQSEGSFIDIDVQSLRPGMYFLRCQASGQPQVLKFIKQ